MVTQKAIRELSDRIAREFKPDKIILFGSYAYGKPTAGSDVDLLVIMPFEGRSSAKALEIRMRVKSDFPMDLLVKTPETVKKRIALEDFFLREITQKGKLLYEASHAGMG